MLADPYSCLPTIRSITLKNLQMHKLKLCIYTSNNIELCKKSITYFREEHIIPSILKHNDCRELDGYTSFSCNSDFRMLRIV